MTEIQNRILGCVGRKGSGKSTRVKELLLYCPRHVVFDVMGEHTAANGKNRFEKPTQLAGFLKWSLGQQTFACAYVPGGAPDEEIEEVSRLVYARGHLAFICEEVPLYGWPGYMPPIFGKLVRTGRHRQIDLCWTAQRAAEVPKTLTSLTDVWILFSQTEPRDLDALADRCGREVADRVARLGLHDFFLWDAITHQELEDSPRLLKRVSETVSRNEPQQQSQRLGRFRGTEI